MRGISVPALQIDVDAVAPRIFLHDADDFREEGVLRSIGVVTERLEDAVRAVIGNGQKPFDVRPHIDIGQHTGNADARFINLPGNPDLEGEKSDLADSVAVIPQGVIHPGISHESPHHTPSMF